MKQKGFIICQKCNATLFKGSWYHTKQVNYKKSTLCPACKMIENNIFEGELVIENISKKNKTLVLNTIKNKGEKGFKNNPNHRIISTIYRNNRLNILTTKNNLYFIESSKGLVKLSQQGEAKIAEITRIAKAIPILVGDSVYVFLQKNVNEGVIWGTIKKDDIGKVEMVFKEQGGKREGGKQEQEIFAKTIFRLDNEFYLMCSRAGGKRFYKLNESEERWIWAGSASVIIDKDMLSAVVDKNNRVYFAGSDYIVGFEKDGDELRQIFSARTGSTSKVVIANGKAYQVSSYLIEAY
jgi:hypothetical protein